MTLDKNRANLVSGWVAEVFPSILELMHRGSLRGALPDQLVQLMLNLGSGHEDARTERMVWIAE
jgi:hypothetical protein